VPKGNGLSRALADDEDGLEVSRAGRCIADDERAIGIAADAVVDGMYDDEEVELENDGCRRGPGPGRCTADRDGETETDPYSEAEESLRWVGRFAIGSIIEDRPMMLSIDNPSCEVY
jgi:hypothetical protein